MRIGLLLFAFCSASAVACPNLTGTYRCIQGNDSETISVRQREANGITYYSGGSGEFPADGQIYKLPDNATWRGGTRIAFCEDSTALVVEFQGIINQPDDQPTVSYHSRSKYYLNEKNGITQDSWVTYKSEGHTDNYEDSMSCERIE